MARQLSSDELEQALNRWQKEGLISAEQAGQILKSEASHPSVTNRPDTAEILTWMGGFLAIVAAAVFIGVDWNNMGGGQQTLWATVAITGLWAIAWILRRNHDDQLHVQVSNVLVIVGTGLIMLWFYAVYRLTGLWPEQSDSMASQDTTSNLMGIAQAVTAIVGVFWSYRLRASWMLLPAGFVGWMAWIAWMDRFQDNAFTETDNDVLRLALYGVLLVIAGLVLTRFGWKNHATWLFVVGLTINLVMLGTRSFENPLGLNGMVFLALTMLAVILGIATDLRIFLIYGAIGLYVWLSSIVIETFGGSRPVAFALILVGVLIVVVGAFWQRRHSSPPPANHDGVVHGMTGDA